MKTLLILLVGFGLFACGSIKEDQHISSGDKELAQKILTMRVLIKYMIVPEPLSRQDLPQVQDIAKYGFVIIILL